MASLVQNLKWITIKTNSVDFFGCMFSKYTEACHNRNCTRCYFVQAKIMYVCAFTEAMYIHVHLIEI